MRALFFAVLFAVAVAGAAGCVSHALDYARAAHPGCTVRELEPAGSGRIVVEITCPGGEPYRRSYAPR
jgi:hypothetical protein